MHRFGLQGLNATLPRASAQPNPLCYPAERYQGKDHDLRHQACQAAKAKNPNRWSGATRNWTPVGAVTLNPDKTPAAKTKVA